MTEMTGSDDSDFKFDRERSTEAGFGLDQAGKQHAGSGRGRNVEYASSQDAATDRTPGLSGYVSNIIFRNADNGYTVLEIKTEEGLEVTATGIFPAVAEGEVLNLYGEYVDHANYGRQFKMTSYEETVPTNADSIRRYIGSGAIKGIGPALAARIVRKFGDDTFRIMEEEPERLSEVKGISMNKAMEISDQMIEKRDLRAAMMYLGKYGIQGNLAVRIYETYGIGLREVLETNPYRMAEEVRGIGFRTADEIAQRVGIQADSAYRARCGILYVLNSAAGRGHTFLRKDDLRRNLRDLLGMEVDDLDGILDDLLADRKIRVVEGEEIYTETLYRLEESSARMLLELDQKADADGESPFGSSGRGRSKNPLGSDRREQSEEFYEGDAQDPFEDSFGNHGQDQSADSFGNNEQDQSADSFGYREQGQSEDLSGRKGRAGSTLEDKEFNRRLDKILKESGLDLDDKQREAVRQAASRGVFILTGGPGTGKTTTIKAMIEYFRKEDCDIMLAAPTGRAAKRMTEATGYEARTIHRMLEVHGGPEDREKEGSTFDGEREREDSFERNSENPLEADVVIIDEMSMVDIYLFHALLCALPAEARLILVGDVNQLPSVGPGNVLHDIIDSGCFSVVRLEKIFRQAAESDIVMNAHRIHNGEEVRLDNKSRDFFFLKRYDANSIIGLMLHYIQGNLPAYVGAKPLDLQVLTPTRKGLTGVENLNKVFQAHLNPPRADRAEFTSGDRIFREGDKVMQIHNNYQMEWRIEGKNGIVKESGSGVFNGDMGIIREINLYTSTMTVLYDDERLVDYDLKELSDLELAYAVTIHKSQGSEYPAVLIPLLSGPQPLMNRNILYTAVTRARKCVLIIGDDRVFRNMIANVSEMHRDTGLKDRILENIR